MKKLFLFSILLLSFVSCQEDTKFNNPSFEGKKDGVLWRASSYNAIVSPNGSLIIEGYSGNEVVTLSVPSTTAKVYPLGENTSNSNTVTYEVMSSKGVTTYSTGIDEDEGEIKIEEYDIVNGTITGTFKFNVTNTDDETLENPVVNFQYGKFYNVPVIKLTL